MKASTGLRNAMLDTGSFKSLMDAGFVKIYAGSVPASADDAVTGTLLCTITDNGGAGGLNFDTAAVAGIIAKAPAQTWRGTNVASGTATYFRYITATDTGVLSTTERRIQGTVANFGADLNLSSVALAASVPQDIDNFVVALPTL